MTHVPAEQLAAALRHLGWVVLPPELWLERGELRLRGRVASWRGREVVLSRRQSQVLAVLLERWPDPITDDGIYAALYDGPVEAGLGAVVRWHVIKLRLLLPGLIRTAERGAGYVLDLGIGS